MLPPARAGKGWGLATVLVLALYGLAQNAARNVFYTQKDRIQQELHCEQQAWCGGHTTLRRIRLQLDSAASPKRPTAPCPPKASESKGTCPAPYLATTSLAPHGPTPPP